MFYSNATAQSLGMMRLWVFGLAAVSRVITPTWEVCLLPNYQAPGVMRALGASYWVPGLPLEAVYLIQGATIVLLLLVAVGLGPYRVLAPLACGALMVTEGLVRGTGIHTHANILLILCTCVLAIFPAADGLTLGRQRKVSATNPLQYQAALVTLSLVFCATYLFVAARRLSSSGLPIYLDDSILAATALRDAERGSSGGLGLWMCESVLGGWAMRLGFPVVTLLELLTPLCLVSSWFRWCWLGMMIPFHIGVGYMMGIWFTYNFALMPFLITGWDPFRDDSSPIVGEWTVAERDVGLKKAA